MSFECSIRQSLDYFDPPAHIVSEIPSCCTCLYALTRMNSLLSKIYYSKLSRYITFKFHFHKLKIKIKISCSSMCPVQDLSPWSLELCNAHFHFHGFRIFRMLYACQRCSKQLITISLSVDKRGAHPLHFFLIN